MGHMLLGADRMEHYKIINRIITAFMVSSALLCGEVTRAYAADSSVRGGTKAVTVLVMITAFIAASVVSAYMTYRIRMRKNAPEVHENEPPKGQITKNDEHNL